MGDVRFDRMVPADVVARREACDLAYLPVGSLEWHGPHMPFGTDYMTVTHLAQESARRFGGVVFPPIYYADVRFYLQECRPEWRNSYARDMKVPKDWPALFGLEYMDKREGPLPTLPPEDGPAADEPLPMTPEEMERDFTRQIARVMMEIHLYGFRNILLMPGHGPNPKYCTAALEVYRQNVRRRKALGEPARTMSFFYIEAAGESEPLLKNHWIHADKWEGSITMAAEPETVRLDQLPPDRKTLVPAYLGYPYLSETDGYNPQYQHIWHSFDGLDPRNGTSAEYGRRQVEAILGVLGKRIEEFMKE